MRPIPQRSSRTLPLRVVYLIGYYGDLTGSQRSLLAVLRELPRDVVQPLVVFPGEGRCTAAYRDAGIPVEVLAAPPELDRFGGAIPRAPATDLVQLAARHVIPYGAHFARLLLRERASVAHFNDMRSTLLAGVAAAAVGVPRVWHVRGDERGQRRFVDVAAAIATRLVCVARALEDTVPAWARSKCRTVHNGIDATPHAPRRTRPSLLAAVSPHVQRGDGDLLVAMIGSRVPFKGAHHLVAALAEIEAAAPEVAARLIVTLVGDEPDAAYARWLRERAARLVTVRVCFVGWDDEPLDWMSAADVIVHPTVATEELTIDGVRHEVRGTEGFPRTVLEAMVCGKPVVATRVMGVPEQVDDGVTGTLCPPSDPAALASDLLRVLQMAEEERARMGAAGRRKVAGFFPVAAAVAGTVAVYRELVGLPVA